MSSQDVFGIVAMFYAVANLGSMGLELKLRETIQAAGIKRQGTRIISMPFGQIRLKSSGLEVSRTSAPDL